MGSPSYNTWTVLQGPVHNQPDPSKLHVWLIRRPQHCLLLGEKTVTCLTSMTSCKFQDNTASVHIGLLASGCQQFSHRAFNFLLTKMYFLCLKCNWCVLISIYAVFTAFPVKPGKLDTSSTFLSVHLCQNCFCARERTNFTLTSIADCCWQVFRAFLIFLL